MPRKQSTRIRSLSLALPVVLVLLGLLISCNNDDGVTTPPEVNKGTPVYVRDFEFAEGRVYDLGAWFEFGDRDTVRMLRVFEENPAGGPGSDSALVRRFPQIDSNFTMIRVTEIPATEFIWVTGFTKFNHFVIFSSPRIKPIAIHMEIARYDIDFVLLGIDTIGSFSDTAINQFKLIRALDADYDSTHSTWDLMWRNVYDIPIGSIFDELFLSVRKGSAGEEGTVSALEYQQNPDDLQSRYLAILGLDQFDSQNNRVADGMLDDQKAVFRPDQGLLIFPARHPFATNSTYTDGFGASTPALQEQVSSIYSLPRQQAPADSSGYFIEYFIQP